MKAAMRTEAGLVVADVEMPRPGPTELLVKVQASSLNRADLFMAEGRVHGAHGGADTRLGLEWSGDVVAVGEKVCGFDVGDRAICTGLGGLAEYAVADWRRCFPFPARPIGYDAAACLPIATRTAFVSLRDLGELAAGQSILVLGASSGVGLMCLQLARLSGAGLVIGTSTKADRREALTRFGADLTLDSADPAWPEQALARTGGTGVDLVVDFLAGPHLNEAMRATKIGGLIVNVGRMAGESAEVDLDLHSIRRIRYVGQTFRTRNTDEIGAIGERLRAELWPAVEDGRIGLPVDARFPLEEVNEAFATMKRNDHFGKIIVTPTS